jgi:hypothetical protein
MKFGPHAKIFFRIGLEEIGTEGGEQGTLVVVPDLPDLDNNNLFVSDVSLLKLALKSMALSEIWFVGAVGHFWPKRPLNMRLL